MDNLTKTAHEWDSAFAEWLRLDSYGPLYRGQRDAVAARMEHLMAIIRQAVTS